MTRSDRVVQAIGIHFLGKKIFIVSQQKNRKKIQKIATYNIHKYIQNKIKNKQHTI